MKTQTHLKKTRKTFAMLLLAAAATFALQGCFGSSNENSNDSKNVTTPVEEVDDNSSNNSKLVFKNLQLEEHAMEDGEEVLKCYFEAEFPELKGHEVRISMYVLDADGEEFFYSDDEGFSVPLCDTEWYKDGVATDKWMSISYNELEVLPEGNYFVRFEAYDNDGREHLGYSKSLPFKK